MPIDFSRLRLAQLFGQGMPPIGMGGNMPQQMQEPEDNYDAGSRLRELYNPQTQFQNQFGDQINQMPQRQDYQLNKVKQIAAAIAGMGAGGPAGMWGGNPVGYRSNIPQGIAIQRNLQNRPFDEATEDWERKLKPLGQAADNERLGNVNERVMANDIIRGEQGDRRLEITSRKNEQTNAINEQKLEIQAKRAKAYIDSQDFKRMHPEMKSYTDKDGMVVFVNPTNPSEIVRTDINTGDLSDIQKHNLELQGDLRKIAATGEQNRITKGTSPAINPNVSKPKPPSSAAESTATKNRIMQAVNANPALRNYFEYDAAGKPTGMLAKSTMFDNAELTKKAREVANGSVNNASPSNTNPMREQAIAELKKRGKIVDENSIKQAIDLINKGVQ